MTRRPAQEKNRTSAWIAVAVLIILALGLSWYFASGAQPEAATATPEIASNTSTPASVTVSPISPVSPVVNNTGSVEEEILVLYDQGLQAYRDGDYQAALDRLGEAIELNPNGLDLLTARGNVYLAMGNLDDAAADYNRVIEVDPNHWFGYYNRGRLLTLKGDYEQALADFDKVMQGEPKLVYNALVNRGVVFFKMQEYDKSMAEFDRAIATDPNQAQAYLDKANLLNTLGKFDEAVAGFDNALRIDTQMARAYWGKGWAEYNLGRFSDSVGSSEQALKLLPDQAAIYFNLGLAQLANSQPEQARDSYREGQQLATPAEIETAIAELETLKENTPGMANTADDIIATLK